MSRIGDKIKAARISKNISLKELGKKCGVSESYLSDVESGKKVINDLLIKKLSGLLDINLNEPMLTDEMPSEDEEAPKEVLRIQKPNQKPSMEWQSAFSSIIKDVPVYDIDMDGVKGFKHLPVIDRKVEGYSPDKLIYIKVPDNSMSGFRMKKDDMVMVALNPELLGAGLYLVEIEGRKEIRHIRKLDSNSVLVINQDEGIKTVTEDIHNVKIIGRCIKAEVDLMNM